MAIGSAIIAGSKGGRKGAACVSVERCEVGEEGAFPPPVPTPAFFLLSCLLAFGLRRLE